MDFSFKHKNKNINYMISNETQFKKFSLCGYQYKKIKYLCNFYAFMSKFY